MYQTLIRIQIIYLHPVSLHYFTIVDDPTILDALLFPQMGHILSSEIVSTLFLYGKHAEFLQPTPEPIGGLLGPSFISEVSFLESFP